MYSNFQPKMNVFRFLADHLHLLSMIFLLGHILHRRSCKSISGKTQLLLATVFVARYSDIFTNFISEYNTIYKVKFNLCILLFGFLGHFCCSDLYYRFFNLRSLPKHLPTRCRYFSDFFADRWHFDLYFHSHELLVFEQLMDIRQCT